MTIAAATRKISKTSSEVGYLDSRPGAKRAATRAVRRSAAAEIAEALDEMEDR